MIGKYMPLSFVGIYTVAAFIPTVIEAPLNAFDRIASAKISFAWSAGDRKQIFDIYHKSSLYMFLLADFFPEYQCKHPYVIDISAARISRRGDSSSNYFHRNTF
ncbi:MAG: hypothetical protein IPI62_05595 [Bacteroidetes bacterium]|nr:hypothetical protein [Bacteroidota bacterium]